MSNGTFRGDTNGLGGVNTTDFLALSRNFGQPGEYTEGDFDKDGTVDVADFLLLSRNFGQGSDFASGATAAAVPEPDSALLILVAGAILCAIAQRKNARMSRR